MGANDTQLLEGNKRDIGFVFDKVSGELVLINVFNTTATAQGASVTLFAIDALGGAKKDIKFGFYLAADAAATFVVTVSKTRAGDLVNFIADVNKTATIPLPGAAGQYTYEAGDLEEGLQMTIAIAQNALGNATNVCDAALTYLG